MRLESGLASSLMKIFCCLALSLTFAPNLFAQQPVTNTAPEPPAPLSSAAMEKIRRMSPLFDGQTLTGWKFSMKGSNAMDPGNAWTVKDGAMASLGTGRGVIYTENEYGDYRLVFKIHHVSGQPDHQACFLIYCVAPEPGKPALDALGGIQFQPPNGGSWDYRPGKNNNGKGLFTRLPHPKFDPHEWSQVEILVHANGTARMAVAQPPGTKAAEVLDFNDPTAGRRGPIAWQMHNKGLFDEYKDVRIEVDPKEDKLVTVE